MTSYLDFTAAAATAAAQGRGRAVAAARPGGPLAGPGLRLALVEAQRLAAHVLPVRGPGSAVRVGCQAHATQAGKSHSKVGVTKSEHWHGD